MKGLFVAALLCVSVGANAGTYYYRTFHVVAKNMTGNGSIYIATQKDESSTERQVFDTDLDAGFSCTMSNGYGRLFFYVNPDAEYAFLGVKVFTVDQDAEEPSDDDIDAASFAPYREEENDVENGIYSVMIFPGDKPGDEGLSEEEYGAWSPYGVYGGTDFNNAAAVPCNENPDAYVYYYFIDIATGIHQVSNATTSTPKVYGLDGREQNLSKGVNIIRFGNTIRKVIIK